MEYKWEIPELNAEGELITHAKYHVTLTDGKNTVETEGNWWFNTPLTLPFLDITEEMVAELIEKETMRDGINVIKSRLEEQINALKNNNTVVAPWLPQVFTPT